MMLVMKFQLLQYPDCNVANYFINDVQIFVSSSWQIKFSVEAQFKLFKYKFLNISLNDHPSGQHSESHLFDKYFLKTC